MAIQDSIHLEGRINAHRRLLVELISVVAAIPAAREALLAMARDNETVFDHEEDPGIEPDAAFAAQQIADDEIRAILEAAMARLETRT
ncbi:MULTISPECIES: hypothetical protein [Shinella]|uniref:Uncharacterized protein n=1 Tax=Shinella granuli TaxID=323621 RepID=A0A4R2D3N3_SHIGR|nr:MULTISPECIES: hypothetical protein [Shinella]ANH04802.1 hypothetical protein shn_12640 [Shinella sp. HZN7]TCN48451.1 hypothetical protein EV665_101185 [Shinella granuli]